MSLVSPPPTSAPFPIPPIALSPPPQLSSPSPASQPNATTPPISTIPPILPPLSASPPSPSPPSGNVTSPPPMASPPTPSAPPTNDPSPTFSPPPLPSSPPPTTPSPPDSSPPPPSSPPPASSPPPQSAPPPASSPPPPLSPPVSSSPPPKADPPPSSPPPQPTPPTSSPPPPPKADPPPSSPPPEPTTPPSSPAPPSKVDPPPPPKVDPPPPPNVDPPPPTEKPSPPPAPQSPGNPSPPQSPEPPKDPSPPPPSPGNSPPSPPASTPPQGSPPTPALDPPKNSPPSPPSPENSPPSPPSVPSQGSPPTPASVPPKSSSPSPPVPSDGTTTNRSSNNPPGSSSNQSSGGIGTGGTVSIGIVLAVLLLGIIGTVGWCIWKRKRKAYRLNGGNVIPTSVGSTPRSDSVLLKIQESTGKGTGSNLLNSPADGLGNPKIWFTYEELAKATADFSAENLLGQGGFGSVHKGRLEDGRDVAVKQLDIGGRQGDREFRAEVEIISRVHHRHLVSLVGYCISENRRLLVYDYVPNNTLYFHLHAEGRPVMDWAMRVKIAVGAARGIAYLHEDCNPRIIHRDIKSSNILLDSNFEARVSDFGLAKLAQDAKTHVTTRVVGTFGYMAPEYASSGKLTEKSDIYSFGVVLLELITGRKPVDTSQPIGEESLVEWARPLLTHALARGEFDQLVDPRLEKNYVVTEMFQLTEAAAACVRHAAAKRPGMGQIVRAFDSMSMYDLSNGMKVGESTIYNSAEQSAEIRLFRRMAFGTPDFSSDFFSQGTQHSGESAEDRV